MRLYVRAIAHSFATLELPAWFVISYDSLRHIRGKIRHTGV